MKKQSFRRRNSSGAGTVLRTIYWPTVFVAAFIFIFMVLRLVVPGVFMALVSPLWQGGTSLNTAIGTIFSGFGNTQKLTLENTALKLQVTTLTNQNLVLTSRAQDLTKLLGGSGTGSTGSGILAGVLVRPPESAYDTLIVAAGSKEGVVVGSEVFGTGGVPIGTVQKVTAHTATVVLISTAGTTTSGWVGESREPLSLVGMGAGAFTASVSKVAAPLVGDNIYIPGPGAVPIGTIASIETDASSPSVTLQILPLVNLFQLTWVEIARS